MRVHRASRAVTSVFIVFLSALASESTMAQCLLEKLSPSDATAQILGYSVSVRGELAIVGARSDDEAGDEAGAAYVFRFDGSTWVEEAKLIASDAAAWDAFGTSVSVFGDAALVGAEGDDYNGNLAGSAYVFRHSGGTWEQEAKLTAWNGAAGDYFAHSVSIFGDVAVVGAPYANATAGAVYVFRHDETSSSWALEQTLSALDASDNDGFGGSVSLSGDVALIGAWGDDQGGDLSGSAYPFRYNGSTWVQEQKLVALDASPDDYFGYSVSVHEDTALAGAPRRDDMGEDSGAAYVFRYSGGAWNQQARLTGSSVGPWDQFGISVSVSGDRAIVGYLLGEGCAYTFRRQNSAWEQVAQLIGGVCGWERGSARLLSVFSDLVSIDGDIAFVGAPGDDEAGPNFGAVYVYSFVPCVADPEDQPDGGQDAGGVPVNLDRLLQWNGATFVSEVEVNPSYPTYLVTHGWNGTPSVMAPCAESLAQVFDNNGTVEANILAWDWSDAANPNNSQDVITQELLDALTDPLRGIWWILFNDVWLDAFLSGLAAYWEGNALGQELAKFPELGNSGLHFIGKSHGGGCLGRAASKLRKLYDRGESDYYVSSITTLDTVAFQSK